MSQKSTGAAWPRETLGLAREGGVCEALSLAHTDDLALLRAWAQAELPREGVAPKRLLRMKWKQPRRLAMLCFQAQRASPSAKASARVLAFACEHFRARVEGGGFSVALGDLDSRPWAREEGFRLSKAPLDAGERLWARAMIAQIARSCGHRLDGEQAALGRMELSASDARWREASRALQALLPRLGMSASELCAQELRFVMGGDAISASCWREGKAAWEDRKLHRA